MVFDSGVKLLTLLAEMSPGGKSEILEILHV